jgi:hypothetical protein
MIINRIYENQHLLSLYLSLVGLRTCQHPCIAARNLIGETEENHDTPFTFVEKIELLENVF